MTKALILAAGMGSRLGMPVPKPLTKLANGQTIMEQQIGNLQKYFSIDDVFVVVGFKKDIIMEAFPDLTYLYNNEFDVTNTSKSLLRGLKKLLSFDVVWLNGDVVFDDRVLSRVLECKKSCIAVNTARVGEEEVKYNLKADGTIKEISKQVKAPLGEALGINKCLQSDLPVLVDHLQKCQPSDYFEKGIEEAISQGMKVLPVEVSDLFCQEIDFMEDLNQVNSKMKS